MRKDFLDTNDKILPIVFSQIVSHLSLLENLFSILATDDEPIKARQI